MISDRLVFSVDKLSHTLGAHSHELLYNGSCQQ